MADVHLYHCLKFGVDEILKQFLKEVSFKHI